MREIYLADKWKRAYARIIDLIIVFGLFSLFYFPFLYPYLKANVSNLYGYLFSFLLFFGISFVFECLIPLFSKNGETIGKKIFKIGLVNKYGYKYKKVSIVFRYFSFLIFDVLFTIFTFGILFIVNLIMFFNSKKRRVIHDYVAGSVVIDTSTSIIFKSKKEEDFYNNRVKNNG